MFRLHFDSQRKKSTAREINADQFTRRFKATLTGPEGSIFESRAFRHFSGGKLLLPI